jgi:hypothetical protein
MAITDSRVKNGTLSLGETPVQFECQATNVRIVPDHTQEDGVETLCGDISEPSLETAWTLSVVAIQDFNDAAGFVNYCWDNNGVAVPFEWVPGPSATSPTFSGTVQIRAVEVGGDVAVQLTTEAEFPCIGQPTRTDPTIPLAAASGSKSK